MEYHISSLISSLVIWDANRPLAGPSNVPGMNQSATTMDNIPLTRPSTYLDISP